MDQDNQRTMARLMAMEQTFETEGWDEIVRELEDEIEVIKAKVLASESWEEVKYLQGKSEQCFNMIYLADTVHNMKGLLTQTSEDESNAVV